MTTGGAVSVREFVTRGELQEPPHLPNGRDDRFPGLRRALANDGAGVVK
jgi:hypothetical protein